ncbi:MAG: hypothetical protein BKP49_02615 [Treponema sp. CETP13]|nr:MAG: hypothetical protein BKP49_02615 [Treponema sp. CETP13]
MTNEKILQELKLLDIDVDTSLIRFLNNTDMYIKYIKEFGSDNSIYDLEKYFTHKEWQKAFEKAHTLKGITGNLGILTLYDKFSKICIAYRKNNFEEMKKIYAKTKREYEDMCKHIAKF